MARMETTTGPLILDAFSGPRGWSEGLRLLGLSDIGIEWDDAACRTAVAAGHATIRADVTAFPIDHLTGRVDGVILSPPCQTFSSAGKGDGRAEFAALRTSIDRGDWTARGPGHEVLEVGRWAEILRPTWIACEQVPPVLPLWDAYAARWRALYGWSVWAGLLLAADYGVPQTRLRAFLLARTDGRPAHPPAATHCKGGAQTMFGELAPWVSMADALGWTGEGAGGAKVATATVATDRPAPTLTGAAGAKGMWQWERPATTIAGDPRITARCHHDDGTQGANAKTTDQVRAGDYEGTEPVKLTLAEALTLQSFPPGYPVQGTKSKQFEQVGNAVPPLLAGHVVAAVAGLHPPSPTTKER
jgi:DNA (cytosine-5)-methyltransferase 1